MWDRTNQVIRGTYMGVPYRGVVGHSRVKLGGVVQHSVDLFDNIEVFGDQRDAILILETDDFSVDCEHFRDYNI
jgi:hypothetical protein